MGYINFKYNYPYCGYGEKGKFQCQWSETRTTLNGSYTYPMVFNKAVPNVSHIKISIEIENTGSGTVLDRQWDFMIKKSNGSWVDISTFIMPSNGKYTVDCDIPNYSISQFAVLPSSNPGSSRTWSNWYGVEEMIITENVELKELITGKFIYGMFTNQYGIDKTVSEVYANIDGSLVPITSVIANVNNQLVSVPSVNSAYLKTTSECLKVFSFTPAQTGKYRIQNKKISGDHEIRVYSSDFTPLYDGYFYSQSFDLTAGTLLYLTVTHYYNADESESYLQIYKEV